MAESDDATEPGFAPTAHVRPAKTGRIEDLPTEQLSVAELDRIRPSLTSGARIAGRYQIVRFVARGGMGEVYEAEDEELHTRVALKTVQPAIADDPATLARFRREIQVARTVTHASVCRVFDLDHHDRPGQPPLAFYTMEFLAGETLAARLRNGALPRDQARRIIVDLADGLGAAHAAGVIHRDLKPANVIVVESGRAVITDFGLALPAGAVGVTSESGASSEGGTTVAGTPAYMAPEMLAGDPPSIATDLYALGTVMFELQTGRLPQSVSSLEEALAAAAAPQPLPGHDAAWRDRRWERATRSCLARVPAERPASAAAVVAMLRPPPRARNAMIVAMVAVAGGAVAVVATTDRTPRASAPGSAPLIDAAVAPPPPPFTPGPLTAMGGCVYAPAFLDDRTLVYDYSKLNVMDVYRLGAGGQPEQLTRDDTWEWRALPGLVADEIVYVVTDVAGNATSRLAARDLVTGVERTLAAQSSPAVAAAGGAYYYVSIDGTRIRKVSGDRDEVAITMPADATAQMIVPSHDGRRLATIGETAATAPRLCVVDLATTLVTCLDLGPITNARPAFAPDDRSILYADDTGVRRSWLEGPPRDDPVVPGVFASGIAVAPAGQVVWTDCAPRGVLHDVSAEPPVAQGTDDRVAAPVLDRDGELAYVRNRRELVVRGTDGKVGQIGVLLESGQQMSGPAFDASGDRLAVTVTGLDSGLYVYDATRLVPPRRITEDRNQTSVAWLGDELLFNQWDDDRPRVYRVGLEGNPPQQALALDRLIMGVDHRRGEVLLAEPDEGTLYWWNPKTGRHRAGPLALAGDVGEAYDYALAPGGRWLAMQLGRQGHALFRQRLDEHGDPDGPAERVFDAPSAASMTDCAIGDDGQIVVAAIEWHGELHAAPELLAK